MDIDDFTDIDLIQQNALTPLADKPKNIDKAKLVDMIGVGTEQAELSANNKFCSLLGLNKESWGFSYKGKIQRNGERRDYSEQFYQGSLVGFFVNRKLLGIAFTGLYNLTLYPMVCSTAPKSIIRLSQCLSIQSSLQMKCSMMLRPTDFTYLKTTFPGLRYLTKSLLTDILRNGQVYKNYAFDREGTPLQSEYLKVRYSPKFPPIESTYLINILSITEPLTR
ncbi:hypothetical protein HCN44_007723 [Aphidius gifuensis]|uniref:Uncharacterized protein n=1 Tax=Aphidius gifuensis TaxID=684658 RepID=A0A835CPI0_APHGI|nr:hypothetical protein HCN44_007723 [Aphidius gifuensis]